MSRILLRNSIDRRVPRKLGEKGLQQTGKYAGDTHVFRELPGDPISTQSRGSITTTRKGKNYGKTKVRRGVN